MEKTVVCRRICAGIGEGEALVCKEPIGFNFSIDIMTGQIIEHGHSLEGVSIKDKVLIFPYGKGSTGGSYVVYQLARANTGPAAIINLNTETIIASGAIMGGIPTVDHLEEDPYEFINTGDFVRVNADEGTVTVVKKEG